MGSNSFERGDVYHSPVITDFPEIHDRPLIAMIQNEVQCTEHPISVLVQQKNNIWANIAQRRTPEDIDYILDNVNGVLILGRDTHVNPFWYGEKPVADVYDKGFDPLRDEFCIEMDKKIIERGIPFFGICGGAQEGAIACGAELFQNLSARFGRFHNPSNSQSEVPYAVHFINNLPGGLFEKIYGPNAKPFEVNSTHEQGLLSLPDCLRAEAVCPNTGVIEAYSHRELPYFGVQFHPDKVRIRGESNPVYIALFSEFSKAARTHWEQNRVLAHETCARPTKRSSADALHGAEMVLSLS